jgi:hypothetical protein
MCCDRNRVKTSDSVYRSKRILDLPIAPNKLL